MTIDANWLNELLGQEYPTDVLTEALEDMGCDVEDVVKLERFRCPVCNVLTQASLGEDVMRTCPTCGHEEEAGLAKAGVMTGIRLDLLAARPDLFDAGGISRALKGFLGQESGLPDYGTGEVALKVLVDPSVTDPKSYRPHIRCAVVELPPLTDESLINVMNLQEALHWGVGRNRKLASIGVYNLDSIKGPIQYRTMDPDNDPFVPLGMPGTSMSGRQILEDHPKGTAYANLLEDLERYPVLVDETGQVLSMPPIINSDETRVELGCSRLFVDVTGPSEAAVVRSLDTLVCSLVELGGRIQQVEITNPDGSKITSPNLKPRSVDIEMDAASKWLGIPFDSGSLQDSLRKMRLDVEPVDSNAGRFRVTYPALRTDIKHMVDIFEDLAIGYGYKRIVAQPLRSMTTGMAREEEDISGVVRSVVTGLGFQEIMSLPMSTEADHYEKLRLPVPDNYPEISNPKLKAMKVVRTHLMSGLLESLQKNRRHPTPIRLFELDNVVRLDDGRDTGTSEERRLAIAEMGEHVGYATIRSIIDALLFELRIPARYEAAEHATFITGRFAELNQGEDLNGFLGEFHPEVLETFGLDFPVAYAEVTLREISLPS